MTSAIAAWQSNLRARSLAALSRPTATKGGQSSIPDRCVQDRQSVRHRAFTRGRRAQARRRIGVSWYRSHYLNIGISGFLSATLVVLMLAYARMGTRMGEKNPGVA